jgi:hypothetical protein
MDRPRRRANLDAILVANPARLLAFVAPGS